MKILVSTQRLAKYSTSTRGKLTLPQYVVGDIPNLFPPELQYARKAELTILLQGPNEGNHPFAVTASLQKLGENAVRVVLLESGWKPVARELQLTEGDTVAIFLLNNTPAWTYSIEVERVPEADQIDEDVVPAKAPIRMEFDLNEPVQLDMEINLNQPNQPVRMEFDLNEPAHPHMEINLND